MTKPKHYVDVRIHFSIEQEDGEFDYVSLKSFERIKVKNLDEGHLDQIGESFGQMDSYQLALQNRLPSVLTEGGKITIKD